MVMTGVLCLVVCGESLQAQDGTEAPGVRIVPPSEVIPNLSRIRNATLQQVLRRRVSLNAVDTPLNDLLEFLEKESPVNAIKLDRPALEAMSIDVASPVTFQADQVTLGQALHRILQPLALRWNMTDSGILVTTWDADSKRTTRVTPVGRLVDAMESDSLPTARAEPGLVESDIEHPLVQAIHRATGGLWNAVAGDGGAVSLKGKTLVVRGTARDHEEVEVLLSGIQLWREGRLKYGSAVLHPQWSPTEDDARIATALKEKRDEVAFDGTPLKDALQYLSDTSGIRIILDAASLEAAEIDSTAAVRQSGRDLTLQAALDMILEPLALTAVIDHGFLVVMTPKDAGVRPPAVIYDIRDLTARFSPDDLIQLIMDDPSIDWEDSIVCPLTGCLIVKHSPAAQQKVAALLQGLREAREDGAEKKRDEGQTDAADLLQMRLYPLRHNRTANQVRDAVVEIVVPKSWAAAGGKGTAHVVEGTMVVRQTREVHKDIAAFVKSLKAAGEGTDW
jgi:hypothetical protein